jgi:hypothetical protein
MQGRVPPNGALQQDAGFDAGQPGLPAAKTACGDRCRRGVRGMTDGQRGLIMQEVSGIIRVLCRIPEGKLNE